MPGPELMTISLIFQSIYAALAQADSTVQLWTTFTFATIVAAHLGADRIKLGTYWLIVSLYGLYSLVAIVKYSAAALQILHYQDLLIARYHEPWPVPAAFGAIIGSGTLFLLIGGSIGTLWFLRSCIRLQNVDNA
jgi:hypothetical protein